MIDIIDRPAWTESIRNVRPIPASGYFGTTKRIIRPARLCDMSRETFVRLMVDVPRRGKSTLNWRGVA